MKLATLLEERGIPFEKTTHPAAYTAQGLAAEEHVSGYAVAKPVVVKGTQGPDGSPPMFPVYPRNLDAAENPDLTALLDNTATEDGTRALAFTNALYADVDGVAGFNPPGCTGRCGVVDCP